MSIAETISIILKPIFKSSSHRIWLLFRAGNKRRDSPVTAFTPTRSRTDDHGRVQEQSAEQKRCGLK